MNDDDPAARRDRALAWVAAGTFTVLAWALIAALIAYVVRI